MTHMVVILLFTFGLHDVLLCVCLCLNYVYVYGGSNDAMIHAIPKWKSIYLSNLQTVDPMIDRHSEDSLKTLSDKYILQLDARGAIHIRTARRDWTLLRDGMMKENTQANDIGAAIDALLSKFKTAGSGSYEDIHKLSSLFARRYASAAASSGSSGSDCGRDEDGSSPPPAPGRKQLKRSQSRSRRRRSRSHERDENEEELQPPQPKRSRRQGNFDVVARATISSLESDARLQSVLDIGARSDEYAGSEGNNRQSFTNGLRVFLSQVVQPVRRCLENHCGNKKDVFIDRWGAKFRVSKFSTMCCKGEGDAGHCSGLDSSV